MTVIKFPKEKKAHPPIAEEIHHNYNCKACGNGNIQLLEITSIIGESDCMKTICDKCGKLTYYKEYGLKRQIIFASILLIISVTISAIIHHLFD